MILISFIFRFQRILELREGFERQTMIKLSRALFEHEQAVIAYEQARGRYEDVLSNLRTIYGKPVLPVDAVQDELAHLRSVQQQMTLALDACHKTERALQKAQAVLQEASRERKTMERLRERHAHEYRIEENRKEQAFMDEIGSRTGRNESEVLAHGNTPMHTPKTILEQTHHEFM